MQQLQASQNLHSSKAYPPQRETMPSVAMSAGDALGGSACWSQDLLTLDVHSLEQSMNGICYDQYLLEQSADRNSLFTTWSSLRMEHAYLSSRFIRMKQGGPLKLVWSENTQPCEGRPAGRIIAPLGENRWAALPPSANSELSITHTEVPGPSICS